MQIVAMFLNSLGILAQSREGTALIRRMRRLPAPDTRLDSWRRERRYCLVRIRFQSDGPFQCR